MFRYTRTNFYKLFSGFTKKNRARIIYADVIPQPHDVHKPIPTPPADVEKWLSDGEE